MHCTRRIAQRAHRCIPRRSLHSVPQLYLADPETDGVPNFYTPSAYKVAWSDYQAHVIDNLNRVSAQTDYENMPLVKTIAQTARQPDNAAVYNYAAQAFSNHFFFDALANSPDSTTPLAPSSASKISRLITSVETSFKSIPEFKAHVAAVASAMLGSGWIWLVLDGSSQLRILSTYNAGTPFDFARLQHADPNTGLTPLKAAGEENEFALYQSMKRSYSLTPVACLSLWQHSYLIDYGVAGKDAYVEKWFEAVDWQKVQARMDDAQHDDRLRSSY